MTEQTRTEEEKDERRISDALLVDLLALIGFALLVVGVWMISMPAALIVAGTLLVAIAVIATVRGGVE
jgi:uncharacterized membrane protein